jgi:four helix bundle protein
MSLSPEELRNRTKTFALRIVKLFRALPAGVEAQVLGKQLLRSGTSMAANYRAVCRARSRAEFASKIGVVAEEADESVFWLELILEAGMVRPQLLGKLPDESRELTAIFTSTKHTLRGRR